MPRSRGPAKVPIVPLAGERVAQPLVVDEALEHRGDRFLEGDRDQLASPPSAASISPRLGDGALPGVAGRTGAQQVADPSRRRRREARDALDVALGEALVAQVGGRLRAVDERRRRSRRPANGHQRLGSAGVDPVAVARELELGDHHRVEQADDVGAGADHEALVGERALEGRGAAELLAALADQDPLAGAGEVGGRGEPVVPAADDDRVPVAARELGDRRRQADPSHRRRDPARVTRSGEVGDAGELLGDLPQAPRGLLVAGPRSTGCTSVGAPRACWKPSGPKNWPPSTPGAVAA